LGNTFNSSAGVSVVRREQVSGDDEKPGRRAESFQERGRGKTGQKEARAEKKREEEKIIASVVVRWRVQALLRSAARISNTGYVWTRVADFSEESQGRDTKRGLKGFRVLPVGFFRSFDSDGRLRRGRFADMD
jgi:hypothetical protein